MPSRLACIALSLLILSSCRRDEPACAPPPTLVIAAGALNGGAVPAMPPRLLTELPFVERGEPGLMLPGLVRSWTASDDGRTWTFRLWDAIPTHGGARLTADVARAHILRMRPETAKFDPVSRDIVSVEAPARDTLVIQLARPTRAIIDSLRTINPGGELPGPRLGTGPYRLVRETADQRDYEAFPEFLGGRPTLPAVQTRLYPSSRAAWAAFLRREVDMLYDAPTSVVQQLAQNPDVALYPVITGHQYLWGFQLKAPRLRDARVRRALNMAIDRAALAKRLFAGYVQVSRGPFSSDYPEARDIEPTWRFDTAAARAELAAARGREAGALEIECLMSSSQPKTEALSTGLEAQLAQINVRLRLTVVPEAEFMRRLAAGEFETYLSQILVRKTQLWPYIFWHSSTPVPFIRANYTAADAALDAAYGAMDDEAARAAARRVHDIMRDDPPAAFLTMVPMIRAVRRRWQLPPAPDIAPGATPEIRESIRLWTLAPDECRSR